MSELKQVRDTIDQIIQLELKYKIEKIIVMLSQKYDLDRQEIYDHLKEFEENIDQSKQQMEYVHIDVNNEKCLGKTKYNTQCSRSRQNDSLFCGSHLNKLPYGRVDAQSEDKALSKKRGRPRKDCREELLLLTV